MDFKKIQLVLGREFSIRVKKKSFIITTIVTPILFAALMIVPSLIMMADWDKDVNKVMVVDDSGVVAQALESGATIEYILPDNTDLEFIKNHLDSLGVYAVMYVSPSLRRDVCLPFRHSQQRDSGRLRRQADQRQGERCDKG